MILLKSLFQLYQPQSFFQATVIMLRMLILPFWKIDQILPRYGLIIDIGCGAGGMSNYLSLSSSERRLLGIDLPGPRIKSALQTVNRRKNVKFIIGNVIDMDIEQAQAYLMIDVLHHVSYNEQKKLLSFLSQQLIEKSLLVIKEVDSSNTIPFLFGHLWEKILYPHQQIYVRTRKEWIRLFSNLGLHCWILTGSPFFPDSTLIFICKKLS